LINCHAAPYVSHLYSRRNVGFCPVATETPFGMRQSRYRGMKKTHLQHAMIATAINVVRTLAWLDKEPLAPTRTSKFAALLVA
jgi:Transposase DDE domain